MFLNKASKLRPNMELEKKSFLDPLTFEVSRRNLRVITSNVQTSIFGVLGFFVLVSDCGGAVRWWVGESLLLNSKKKLIIPTTFGYKNKNQNKPL